MSQICILLGLAQPTIPIPAIHPSFRRGRKGLGSSPIQVEQLTAAVLHCYLFHVGYWLTVVLSSPHRPFSVMIRYGNNTLYCVVQMEMDKVSNYKETNNPAFESDRSSVMLKLSLLTCPFCAFISIIIHYCISLLLLS